MSYEAESLKHLRKSLDEEEDDTNIIHILENHHKYLKEYSDLLIHADVPINSKRSTLSLFLRILNMHARAEEETFYQVLQESRNHQVRLEGLRGHDEHEIAYEIVEELKELGAEDTWTEEIDAKVRVLAGLIKGHIKEEETIMFPLAHKFIPESKLIDLTDDYLDKCKLSLDKKMENKIPSEVSMSDVMTFFY